DGPRREQGRDRLAAGRDVVELTTHERGQDAPAPVGRHDRNTADPCCTNNVAAGNCDPEREGQRRAYWLGTIEGHQGPLGFDHEPVVAKHLLGRPVRVERVVGDAAECGGLGLVHWPGGITTGWPPARLRTPTSAARASPL